MSHQPPVKTREHKQFHFTLFFCEVVVLTRIERPHSAGTSLQSVDYDKDKAPSAIESVEDWFLRFGRPYSTYKVVYLIEYACLELLEARLFKWYRYSRTPCPLYKKDFCSAVGNYYLGCYFTLLY